MKNTFPFSTFYRLKDISSHTIFSQANIMNKELTSFLMKHNAPNEWFLLDNSSPNVIQTIYKNFYLDNFFFFLFLEAFSIIL